MFCVEQIKKNPEYFYITPRSEFPKIPSLGDDWKPSTCVLPLRYLHYANIIHDFEVKPDDIWIITFPKCGTTWTQEMTWLIQNNLDYQTARNVELDTRMVFIEWQGIKSNVKRNTIEEAKNLKSPRIIKSHLPLSFLPKQLWTVKPKIIYTARNPKDAAVSYYHFSRVVTGENCTPEDFFDQILEDTCTWTPFWTHVLEFWKLRNDQNVLFLTYEEMFYDLRKVVDKCCKFLNKNYSKSDIDQLVEHLSFESMKKNPGCNYEHLIEMKLQEHGFEKNSFKFMRKGKVGSYKEEMPKEYIEKFDKWTEKHLKGTDYVCNY